MRTLEELAAFFDEQEDEFLKFERVKDKLSKRPDLHAFLLLDKIVPPKAKAEADDMIAGAEHDEIWLDVDAEKLAAVATDAQLIDLIRCGIRYDDEHDSLAMFV